VIGEDRPANVEAESKVPIEDSAVPESPRRITSMFEHEVARTSAVADARATIAAPSLFLGESVETNARIRAESELSTLASPAAISGPVSRPEMGAFRHQLLDSARG